MSSAEPHERTPGSPAAEVSRHVVRLFAEYTGRGPTKARTIIDGHVDALERLVLADRTAELAAASRHNLLSVAGTATPAERAWVLAWHLLAATGRLHSGASAAGHPIFGERESSDAATLTRQALGELRTLVRTERQLELRADLTPSTLSLHAQLQLFAPVLPRR
jgi:hypothetical protein